MKDKKYINVNKGDICHMLYVLKKSKFVISNTKSRYKAVSNTFYISIWATIFIIIKSIIELKLELLLIAIPLLFLTFYIYKLDDYKFDKEVVIEWLEDLVKEKQN